MTSTAVCLLVLSCSESFHCLNGTVSLVLEWYAIHIRMDWITIQHFIFELLRNTHETRGRENCGLISREKYEKIRHVTAVQCNWITSARLPAKTNNERLCATQLWIFRAENTQMNFSYLTISRIQTTDENCWWWCSLQLRRVRSLFYTFSLMVQFQSRKVFFYGNFPFCFFLFCANHLPSLASAILFYILLCSAIVTTYSLNAGASRALWAQRKKRVLEAAARSVEMNWDHVPSGALHCLNVCNKMNSLLWSSAAVAVARERDPIEEISFSSCTLVLL